MGALSTRLLRDKPDHPPNPTTQNPVPILVTGHLVENLSEPLVRARDGRPVEVVQEDVDAAAARLP